MFSLVYKCDIVLLFVNKALHSCVEDAKVGDDTFELNAEERPLISFNNDDVPLSTLI